MDATNNTATPSDNSIHTINDTDAHELDEFNLRLSDAFARLEQSRISLWTIACQARIYHKDCREIATSYGRIVVAFLQRRGGMEHATILNIKQQLERIEKLLNPLFQKCTNKRSVPSELLDKDIGQAFDKLEECAHQLEGVPSNIGKPATPIESSMRNASHDSLKHHDERRMPPPLTPEPEDISPTILPKTSYGNEGFIDVPNLSSSVLRIDSVTNSVTTFHKLGGFGIVRRALLVGMKHVAIKTLQPRKYTNEQDSEPPRRDDKLPRRFFSEVSVWRQLHHKNILEFLGLVECSEHNLPLSMVSPWMMNGNVTEYLQKKLSAKRLPLILGVAEGIQFLHSKGVVHGDIKGPNILISDSLEPLLCDFGLAKFCETYNDQNVSTTLRYAGSTRYMAIELLWEGATKTTEGSDMWAFGMTCIEILTAQVPYQGLIDGRVIINVSNEEFPERPADCPDLLWSFMRGCWNKSIEDRPTSRAAVKLLSGILQPPTTVTYNVIDHPLA